MGVSIKYLLSFIAGINISVDRFQLWIPLRSSPSPQVQRYKSFERPRRFSASHLSFNGFCFISNIAFSFMGGGGATGLFWRGEMGYSFRVLHYSHLDEMKLIILAGVKFRLLHPLSLFHAPAVSLRGDSKNLLHIVSRG